MRNIVDVIRERKKMKKKEGYNYSKDVNRNNCVHKRPKIFEVKAEWQMGTASFIIECKDCTKIGTVDGTVDYYQDEVQWQND